jgi:hypothetical protein
MTVNSSDTIIDGKSCKVLLRSTGGMPGYGKIFVHLDSGVVYLYDDYVKVFHQLYDFDADTSQSWMIIIPNGSQFEPDSFVVKPFWKGQITINNKTLRRDSLSFTHLNAPGVYQIPKKIAATEYMGYEQTDFFPWHHGWADGDYVGQLRCFEDSYVGHYGMREIDCELGIEEPVSKLRFKLFPNPASNSVTIEFPESIGNARVTLFDVTGRLSYSESVSLLGTDINLKGLDPGVYFVRVETANGSHTEKLIVK